MKTLNDFVKEKNRIEDLTSELKKYSSKIDARISLFFNHNTDELRDQNLLKAYEYLGLAHDITEELIRKITAEIHKGKHED